MAGSYSDQIAQYVKENELDKLVSFEDQRPELDQNERVDPSVITPYAADWEDLVRLHKLVVSRKVTTILELGVGKSTLVLAHALNLNRRQHGPFVTDNLRRHNAFELHSVDDLLDYIELTKGRMPKTLSSLAHFHHSPVEVSTFNDRICTFYERLPNICPDFIYLDGPSQASAKGDVRGIGTDHPDRVPMAGDLLAMEHFLLPGTLIVVDGRTANARFLRHNFQRDWAYEHQADADIHVFELKEAPLGAYNQRQIEFCLGPD